MAKKYRKRLRRKNPNKKVRRNLRKKASKRKLRRNPRRKSTTCRRKNPKKVTRTRKRKRNPRKYHHIRLRDPGRFGRIRTITFGKGVKARIGFPKGARKKKGKGSSKVITLLFDADKYTMPEAKKWVKKHPSVGKTIKKVLKATV